MNSKDLYYAIGEVDDDSLERSEAAPKKSGWLKWGMAAACLCLAVIGIALWRQPASSPSEAAGITVSESGVTIPPMEVSLSASANENACMIAFFIYQGRCYVHYERIDSGVDIVGEYLGTATGLIDVWTPKSGYVDFAGSVKGDFYAVKGYDPSFMLCMKGLDGKVSIYICNNGITLKYGSELYEDRLHLSENVESVRYESRFSWYFGKGEQYQLNSVNDVILDFIRGLDSAQFVPADSVPLGEGQTYIVDTEVYHLYFQMKDGTTAHLRLHENGYVRFDGIRDVCVQVPEESYGALLDLLDSRADSTAMEVEPAGPTLEDCRNDAELGRYVPAYAPGDINFAYAGIYYYLDRQTANEIGTKEIWLDYDSLENRYYSIIITWAKEYGQNGWDTPMIDAAELSVDAVSEYIRTETVNGDPIPGGSLNMGVWHGDVSVTISAHGVDAETAYQILSSVQPS